MQLVGGLIIATIAMLPATQPVRAEGNSAPVVNIAYPGKCIAPTEKIRRDHSRMLDHQRDRTMYLGIRNEPASLKECVNCHADKSTNTVLGKDGFCQSCHVYAAVQPDCFQCHSAKRMPSWKHSPIAGAGKAPAGTMTHLASEDKR